jgi:hypothetical protein
MAGAGCSALAKRHGVWPVALTLLVLRVAPVALALFAFAVMCAQRPTTVLAALGAATGDDPVVVLGLRRMLCDGTREWAQ